jgi:hypothetical protein
MLKPDAEKKILELLVIVRAFLEGGKVGNIQVNCFKGGISSVNINETVKLND